MLRISYFRCKLQNKLKRKNKNNYLKRVVLLGIALFLCLLVSQSQEYNFKKLTTDQGLSKPGVYAIELDGIGNLWIGTEGGGVNIYDGYEIKPYTAHNLGAYIRTIHKAANGAMWVGDENLGVSIVYNQDSVFRLSDQNGLYANHIRDIKSISPQKQVVAAIGGGIAFIENRQVVKVLTQKDGLPSLNIKALSVKNKLVFAATENGLVKIVNDSVVNVYNSLNSTLSNDILCLEAMGNEGVWIGANKGLYCLRGDSIEEIGRFKSLRVKALLKNGDFLWLGTNQGLIRFNTVTNAVKWFDEENGLSNNRVRCLLADAHGGVWMGTYFAGINCFDTPHFYLLNRSEGLPENVVTAIDFTLTSNNLVVGTSTKGAAILSNGKPVYYNKNNGLSEDEVNCVLGVDSEKVLVGSVEGLNLCSNGEIIEVWDNYAGAFNNNGIKTLVSLDSIVIGLTNAGEPFVLVKDSSTIRLSVKKSRKLQAEIGAEVTAAASHNGKIYFFSTNKTSVFELKNGLLTPFAKAAFQGVKLTSHSTSHYPLLVNKKNELFIIAGDTTFKLIKRLPKLADVKAVLAVNDTQVWLALKTSIQKLTFLTDSSRISTYTINNGFLGRVFSGGQIVKTSTSLLLFPSIRGVFVADLQPHHKNEKQIKVQLEELLLDGEVSNWLLYSDSVVNSLPYGLKLPYKLNNLTFKYNAHYLKSSASITYFFKVTGATDFELTTQKREVNFIDLAPGDYNVVIKAKSTEGEWSEELSYNFAITPPFWETIWFYISIFGIVGMSIYIFIRRKTIKLEKEKFKLELIVAERTQDLNKEKQKSDDLLLNILPAEVANELKLNGKSPARCFAEASVLFTDFKGFTRMSSQMPPDKLVEKLDQIFMGFDEIVDKHHLEKIKTIGDAYMCVGGLPQPNTTHAFDAVSAGVDMVGFMKTFNEKQKLLGDPEWLIRVGVHTGELVSGVVGKKKFAYDVWGDTVNIASRMESNSEPNKVNISEATKVLVEHQFNLFYRGEIEAKNRGALAMYFVQKKYYPEAISDLKDE